MRGGMGGGAGVPIGQRPTFGAGQPEKSAAPKVRHCWIQHAGGEYPGIVVRWDLVDDLWLATVAWVEEADALRVERVMAHRLRKA